MSADGERQARFLVVGIFLTLFSRPVHADVAGAEALFQQGRELRDQGRMAEACDLFAESQRLDPSSGTLINLAACHETLGKTATAWAEFLATARLAFAQGRLDRADEAERRAADLAPKLMRLTIRVRSAPVEPVVKRDDAIVALGVAIPVDPGSHVISATAPGYATWTQTVSLDEEGQNLQVEIPPLTPLRPPPAKPYPMRRSRFSSTTRERQPVQSDRSRPLPVGLWASGATSVAALGVGSVFGVLSLRSYDSAESLCQSHTLCSDEALQTRDRAEMQANVSNVAFASAFAAAVVAGWLYLSH
jgi:tetratricopeptide (TPR) repeat protein